MSDMLVEMKNICKQFDGNLVLNNIDFFIRSGEVCSLLGKNSAGKTTLMKILAGAYVQDSGQIIVDGREITFKSTIAAQKSGIHMIYHEPQLIESFTVEANIFIGKEKCYKYTPFINRKYEFKRVNELLQDLQIKININRLVEELSLAEKKLVEIAKAVLYDVKVLIFDEITETFSEPEINLIFSIIEKLKKMGVAVIFISHKIDEVMRISDRYVIIRDGELIENIVNSEKTNLNEIFRKMTGEDYINRYPKTRAKRGRAILELQNAGNSMGSVRNASLYIRKGEIIGVAGLRGAGKSSLLRLVAGDEKLVQGKILLNKEPVNFKNPSQAILKGIIYLSENPKLNLNLFMDIPFNITFSNLRKVKKAFMISSKKIEEVAKSFIRRLNLRIRDLKAPVRNLSRGLQQKVALAKWLYADAELLVLDEPSTNLDVNSKVELYNILNQLAHNGKSILIASADLHELIGMCDRIYVMRSGTIVSEMNAAETDSVMIMQFASGELVPNHSA